MLLIGLDDTDSPHGGCTTAFAAVVQARFSHLHPDGPPRLVRLNPNVPWKTRGNAAIALRFRETADLDDTLAAVMAILERDAQRHEGTAPGAVVASAPLPARLYDAAVSRVLDQSEVELALREAGARFAGGRGVIGAAAALAWPAQRATYERIAYRAPERVGTPRDVDAAWAREVEWTYSSTFGTYDLAEREACCIPGGPDPVLWGLRGRDPKDLEAASAILGPERPARETLFLTNQGTDDHLRDRRAIEAREFESIRLRGRVASPPRERNGTVFVDVEDETGLVRAAAYPPTRSFRHLVRRLAPGDELTVCGGLHRGPDGALTLGLEKLQLHRAVPRRAGAPACPACGRSMKSAGRDAGYRCRECGTKTDAARLADAAIAPGWHEVPAVARRHLARPIRLEPSAKGPAGL